MHSGDVCGCLAPHQVATEVSRICFFFIHFMLFRSCRLLCSQLFLFLFFFTSLASFFPLLIRCFCWKSDNQAYIIQLRKEQILREFLSISVWTLRPRLWLILETLFFLLFDPMFIVSEVAIKHLCRLHSICITYNYIVYFKRHTTSKRVIVLSNCSECKIDLWYILWVFRVLKYNFLKQSPASLKYFGIICSENYCD